jgi:hypothetical protein
MNVLLALDSAMGMFNNVPTRVSYYELDLQLPCHQQFFELSSYTEMLQKSLFPPPRMKLIDAFQKFFQPQSEIKFAFQAESLCCWDMLYLIHGLFIFHRPSLSFPFHYHKICNGMLTSH